MRTLFYAVLLFLPPLLAAQGQPQKLSPELRAQLLREASALEGQAAAADPKDAELYMRLGYTYSRLEQADDAQRAFESAVRINPKKDAAYYMLGLIYEKKGLKAQALAAWNSCLQVTADPRMKDTAQKHIHHLSRP